MYGAGNYNLAKFSTWFKEFDKDNSGGIEKSEFAEFVGRVARTAMFGHQNTAGHQEQLNEGKHYIKKLVNFYRLNKLDYLSACDFIRKIFRSFDLDGNSNLDKFETRLLMEAFSGEMNTIGTAFSRSAFREKFAQIDADGSGDLSLPELIESLCNILLIDIPK